MTDQERQVPDPAVNPSPTPSQRWTKWRDTFRPLVRSRLGWALGFGGAAATVTGVTMVATGSVPWTRPWFWFAVLIATPILAAGAVALRELVERPRRRPLPVWRNRRRAFFFDWVFIWAAWIPVWLTGWPGFWCYDAGNAYRLASAGTLSTSMPPFHTFLATGLQDAVARWTGHPNYGIAAFIALQSITVAAVFAYALRRLRAWGAPRLIRWGGLAYFALFPTIALFSLNWARNTAFSAVVLLLAVCLVDALKQPRRWRWVLVGVVALAAIALRRDAIYVFIAFTVLTAILYQPARKPLAICFGTATIAGLLLDPVVYKGIMGLPQGTDVATYSIPLQQMARVYVKEPESLSASQQRQIESFISPKALSEYRPHLADLVIVGADMTKINQDTNGFFRLWAEVGLEHPTTYADAAVANTVQGWLPGAVIDAYSGPGPGGATNPEDGTSYFCFRTEIPGQATPKGPAWIHNVYGDLSGNSRLPFELPVIGLIWSPATYLWLTVFAFALTAVKTRRGRPSAFLPVALLLLATCLPIFAGPTMLVRYFLQLFYCLPLLAAYLADARVYRLPAFNTVNR
ncbi:MAG: DUF6020 family protein [Bifidobacteriaceae bacterium]|jgi:hypothetical protein|nr:DUF6020 family protein [Bifidobacteriaceae bacterium]